MFFVSTASRGQLLVAVAFLVMTVKHIFVADLVLFNVKSN